MNESDFSRDIVRRLTAADNRTLGWKHSDQFSAGWPDLTLLGPAGTILVEHKLIKREKLPLSIKPSLSEQQRRRLNALHKTQPQNVFVCVGIQHARMLTVAVFRMPTQWGESTELSTLPLFSRDEYVRYLLSFLT